MTSVESDQKVPSIAVDNRTKVKSRASTLLHVNSIILQDTIS